jgi:hypothetical protein
MSTLWLYFELVKNEWMSFFSANFVKQPVGYYLIPKWSHFKQIHVIVHVANSKFGIHVYLPRLSHRACATFKFTHYIFP